MKKSFFEIPATKEENKNQQSSSEEEEEEDKEEQKVLENEMVNIFNFI